jgi:hypothetical protein
LIIIFCLINTKNKFSYIYLIILISLILFIPQIFFKGIPHLNSPIEISLLKEFVSDFGGIYGFSIFNIFLSVMGLFVLWKRNNKIYSNYFISLIVFLLGFLIPDINYVYFLILSFFSGYAIYHYYSTKWNLQFLKGLTLLIIICGIFLSFLSFTIRHVAFDPSTDLVSALGYLKDKEQGNVLSDYRYGFMISYLSNHKPLITTQFDYVKNPDVVYNNTLILFKSRNLVETKFLLSSYGIRYILITPEMRYSIWQKDTGILFLFRNKEVFKNIYSNNGYEIWEVIG